jgi:hypothetical protein
LNVSEITESLVDSVLAQRVGKTSNVKRGSGRRELVTEVSSSFLASGSVVSWGGEVDSDRSSVNLLAVQLDGLGRLLEGRERDETEPSGLASVSVHHDLGRDDLSTLGKLGLQPVVVNVPR